METSKKMKHGKFSESDKIVVEEDNSVTIDDLLNRATG